MGEETKTIKKIRGKRTIWLTKHIDFNQGIDARLLNEDKMKLLAKLEIRPLRIAFDSADKKSLDTYVQAQKLAAKYKIKTLSNYILFNYKDTPRELYDRLKINIDLNNEFKNQNLDTSIWSFPMKYMPVEGEYCKDRKYVSVNWNKKLLRGVQCVLNATHGVVGPKQAFFEHAFGETYEDFLSILYMPEHLIINRKENEEKGNIFKWREMYFSLNKEEMELLIDLIKDNRFEQKNINNEKVAQIYKLYLKK